MAESEENTGYEIGKWYMVEIDRKVFIPAKFIGLRKPCPLPIELSHDFPHPGQAVFENVKIYSGCGFKGADWKEDSGYRNLGIGGRYTNFAPTFRPVTENELWAVRAIEKFQEIVAGREKSFSITMNNGCRLEGKIQPPKKKDNLAGEYYSKVINPKTRESKEGKFDYDGKSESVQVYLLSRLPGWHIIEVKQQKIFFGIPQKSN